MWLILAVQIVSIAIIAERIYALYIVRAPKQKKIANGLERDIKAGNIENTLRKIARIAPRHAIANVAQAGIEAAKNMGGRNEIQAKMDEVLAHENARLEKRTGFLAMLGNVGTLLGLLGTIVGLIKAFSGVVDQNPVEKAAMLSQGISMAMSTTAYGLIMAIPALIMFAVLQNRANELAEDLNQGSTKIYNWLSFNFDIIENKKTKAVKGK
ncbi:MAG: MotA/TolQ/ExbB proton channel family protein [Pseudobdellovibrionaceae bacterium]|nr:MotA/TolQ/ExbB proton channel family protein [Bdellovibrionales bacterium]USN48923.1 MAG: MotA/TolQ/ExbB proton channel family protein [Pseudobdellovibrionaceae bacterium]